MTSSNGDADGVFTQRAGAAMIVTLMRPDRANSYTQAMLAQLLEAVQVAEADASVRAIVITGAGERAFCGGADRTEIANRDWRSVLNLRSASVFDKLRKTPIVTIAAINGAAVGGGFELALSCDLRIALPGARFWLPEPEFGLLPAAAATRMLPKLVGALRARDLILGGAVWNAQQALQAGLLTDMAPDGQLMACVADWIARIERRDADALMLAKQAIEMSSIGADTQPFDLLAQALLVSRQTDRQNQPK